MTTSIHFLGEWKKQGAISGLKRGTYGYKNDRNPLPKTTRNIYKLACRAWRMSVSDAPKHDNADQALVDEWLSALIILDATTALKAQPDYVALHCPWMRDRVVHHQPNEILWKMRIKNHANNPLG